MDKMDERPSYYAIIPAIIRYDNRLSSTEKLLYGEITALSNKLGYCVATNRYFAELYNLTEATISVSISKLATCGYIDVVIEQNYKRKIYLLDARVLENSNGVYQENLMGVLDKPNRGVLEKSKDNNININTISNNKINKEKPKEVKHRYGEYGNVLLSDSEMDKLQAEFPLDWKQRIENVSGYCKSTGRTYKDYLATIRNWARRERKPVKWNDVQAGYQEAMVLLGGEEDGQ